MAIVRKLSGLETSGNGGKAMDSKSSPATAQKMQLPNPQDGADSTRPSSKTNNDSPTATSTNPKKQDSPLRRAALVVLPILNGLLHLRVFCLSVFCLFVQTTANTTLQQQQERPESILNMEQAQAYSATLDHAVFFAYLMDLVSTFGCQIIPLSRVTSGMDIFVHHMPIIVMVMIGLPVSSPWCYALDPWFHEMISYAHNQSHLAGQQKLLLTTTKSNKPPSEWLFQKSQRTFQAAYLSQGFGFMSSLNEVLMSFQQAELNWNGVPSLRQAQLEWFTTDDDNATRTSRKFSFFTRPVMIGVELYFKVSIFCGWGVLCFFALTKLWWEGLDYLLHLYNDVDEYQNYDNLTNLSQVWALLSNSQLGKAALNLMTSPMHLRSMISIVFLVSMYPAMAWRTMNKIRRYHADLYRRQQGKKKVA
eukprot:CAMPEP_0168743922 /NCGR_PEP_ID=MMETSP0724-20121128/13827_1 /TAXON_ID=265536 /ORGANISM="Amphiprora sp., Strain CCMP467" /LENGTH=418 /DNA_ID=CAMNT_0008791569 /DNA_START=8 /DNA_END=1264 /DNA_ORIENTATION=-